MFTRGLKTKALSMAMGLLLTTALFSGCSESTASSAAAGTTNTTGIISVAFDSDDLNSTWDAAQATNINLAGNTASVNGAGAAVNKDTITIQSSGTYAISGTLNDGQIIVDTDDDSTVRLVLNGASITCLNSAPIYVKNAEKTVIILAGGTTSTITDGSDYTQVDASSDEPDAAVFSKDDLTINGSGSLAVHGNYNGIHSKDELKITGGNITVTAAADGLKGKDCLAVQDGNLNISAQKDGMQSTNSEDALQGFVYIDGGTVMITAGADGIQAESSVFVKDGALTISSGGGNRNGASGVNTPGPGSSSSTSSNAENTVSTKGIKAGDSIVVENGKIVLDTADDALHSSKAIIINGGVIDINAGDDGIHADASLVVNTGSISINRSYEGLESAAVTINDGNIHVTASDDGINTAGGNDGSAINGRPGQNSFESSDGSRLDINGGTIVVNAQGDGIDVNGDFQMTAGTVIVNGPTSDGNGALDYNGTYTMNGGLLVAAGSAGMAKAPSTTSSQASIKLNLASQSAGTLINIQNKNGQSILTFAPVKNYASVVFSSPQLEKGATYKVYVGGSSNGIEMDGMYSGGSYTAGTQVASLTVSGTVTEYGQSGGSMSGRPMGPGRPNQ